jgi:hypothetical protein
MSTNKGCVKEGDCKKQQQRSWKTGKAKEIFLRAERKRKQEKNENAREGDAVFLNTIIQKVVEYGTEAKKGVGLC